MPGAVGQKPMMLAAVHPGPVSPDPAPHPFHLELEKGVSRNCPLRSVIVGQIRSRLLLVALPATLGGLILSLVWIVSRWSSPVRELEAHLACLQCAKP